MPDPHPLLGPLVDLLGSWEGDGTGRLPGQPEFTWHERLRIETAGAPALAFHQRTTKPDGSPFHAEDGWLRVPPELQEDEPQGRRRIEMAVTSPTGILESLGGEAETTPDGFLLEARSTAVARTPAAGHVLHTRRRWTWDGETLTVAFWMATPDHPEPFHHLTAHLLRAS